MCLQTVLLNTLTSEYIIMDNPLPQQEPIKGLYLLNTHLFVHGPGSWWVGPCNRYLNVGFWRTAVSCGQFRILFKWKKTNIKFCFQNLVMQFVPKILEIWVFFIMVWLHFVFLWVITFCSLAGGTNFLQGWKSFLWCPISWYQRLRETFCLHHQNKRSFFRSEEGGSMFL